MLFDKVTFSVQGGMNFPLPGLVRIRQQFHQDHVESPREETCRTLGRLSLPDLNGKRVGITAGSRKLANLPEILRAAADFLRQRGAQPFIIPAMGSHGGATAVGQVRLLAELGITEEAVGMPIVSSMETAQIGTLSDGSAVVCSTTALQADYVVVCARVKPHTSIKGPVESGLCKMMMVGLGKHAGATRFHRHGYHRLAEILPQGGQVFINNLNILCGLALVENAYDQTMLIEAVPPSCLIEREIELLRLSKENMPRFLLDEIDVLIIERIGKDISGAGMDPNITGRAITPLPMTVPVPIRSIVALDLTEASHGNAVGIGAAEFTTRRVAEKIDFTPSYTNVLTSGALTAMKLPLIMNDDEQAIRAAIRCAPCGSLEEVRVVRIADTLHLSEFDVSENYLPQLRGRPDITVLGPSALRFDAAGRLI